MKINSDLSEKGPKGKSFAPDKLKNHTGKGKGKEKKKRKSKEEERSWGEKKKAMVSYPYNGNG